MGNNLLGDLAGVASDSRRIKDYGAMIALRFGRWARRYRINGRFRPRWIIWFRIAGSSRDRHRRSELFVDLLSRCLRPHDQPPGQMRRCGKPYKSTNLHFPTITFPPDLAPVSWSRSGMRFYHSWEFGLSEVDESTELPLAIPVRQPFPIASFIVTQSGSTKLT